MSRPRNFALSTVLILLLGCALLWLLRTPDTIDVSDATAPLPPSSASEASDPTSVDPPPSNSTVTSPPAATPAEVDPTDHLSSAHDPEPDEAGSNEPPPADESAEIEPLPEAALERGFPVDLRIAFPLIEGATTWRPLRDDVLLAGCERLPTSESGKLALDLPAEISADPSHVFSEALRLKPTEKQFAIAILVQFEPWDDVGRMTGDLLFFASQRKLAVSELTLDGRIELEVNVPTIRTTIEAQASSTLELSLEPASAMFYVREAWNDLSQDVWPRQVLPLDDRRIRSRWNGKCRGESDRFGKLRLHELPDELALSHRVTITRDGAPAENWILDWGRDTPVRRRTRSSLADRVAFPVDGGEYIAYPDLPLPLPQFRLEGEVLPEPDVLAKATVVGTLRGDDPPWGTAHFDVNTGRWEWVSQYGRSGFWSLDSRGVPVRYRLTIPGYEPSEVEAMLGNRYDTVVIPIRPVTSTTER